MQLQWIVFELFFAGTDTTSATLRFAILYMVTYPEIQRKVQQELDDVIGREKLPTTRDRHNLPYTDATLLEVRALVGSPEKKADKQI